MKKAKKETVVVVPMSMMVEASRIAEATGALVVVNPEATEVKVLYIDA